jgi:hypothetical protein
MKAISILIVVFCLFLFGIDTFAQNAIVNNDLAFGDIFPGIPKAIAKTTPGSAAEFFISGTAGSEVAIDFTLPTYMNFSGNNMQLIFRETDCALDTSSTPDQTNPGSNNLDPWHTITYRLGSGGLTIWLGGMVVPKLRQREGNYSATIVLTVIYTGN